MKSFKLLLLSGLLISASSILSGCDSGGSDGGGSSVSCDDIAGQYYGSFKDNCAGGSYVSGEMTVSVDAECSFSGSSSHRVLIAGSFTSRDGGALHGNGTTDSSGCGEFNINCNHSGNSVSCSYSYANGRDGSYSGQRR
ncbi:MAG: hypothetical protein ABFS19_07230 [Thermodesulfobacteriota bacterium]